MMPQPSPRFLSLIEALESRIAPALVLANPLPDLVAGSGKTGATIDLSKMFDPAAANPNHTVVELITNVDVDPDPAKFVAGKIVIELYDDTAPLSVQNFLNYVNNVNAKGDYDGTIFHRAVTGFVLQGGGFEAITPTTHIPVAPAVHNEPDAVNRPNVRGTIAMAKVGDNPNSATSEWFVNLADNRSNLDNQNGGFTVFGEIISGMDLVDSIVAGQHVSLGGALTDLPVQNGYNADPDNNPATPSPTPTLDQSVRIVDAKVQTPTTGDTSGIVYTVSAFKDGTAVKSDLLTASISGSKLNLKYLAGKAGFADVEVKATRDCVTVSDTFKVDVRPNLLIDIDADGMQGIIVPGDLATVKFHLTNTGAGSATGLVNIQFGLVKLTPTIDTSTGTPIVTGFSASTETPGTVAVFNNVAINLAGGKALSFTKTFQLPTDFFPDDASTALEGTVYQLVAMVTPVVPDAGSTGPVAIPERFSDDNSDLGNGAHHAVNRFGTFNGSELGTFTSSLANAFGSRTNAVLTYTDQNAALQETDVTWSMKGGGEGRFTLDALGNVALETFGTNLSSTLTATVPKGARHVPLTGIQFDDALGTAALGVIDLQGFMSAAAGFKSLVLGDLTGQSIMLINPIPQDTTTKATITLGRVHDFSLESFLPIASLTAVEWLDTAGTSNDYISATAVGALKITGATGTAASRGDFEADLELTDSTPIASLTIAGLLKNSTIRAFGNIGTVTLGGMDHSNLFAGVASRPDEFSDFGDELTISSFTIKGIKGFTDPLFTDSQVAAQTLGTIKVTGVATASGSGDFGFVAGVIKSYSRVGGVTKSNVTLPTTIEDVGNYVVQVV